MVIITQILHQQEGATPIPLSAFILTTSTTPTPVIDPGQTLITIAQEAGNAIRIVTASNREGSTSYNFPTPIGVYIHKSSGSLVQSTQFLDAAGNKIFVIDDDPSGSDGYYEGGVTFWPSSKITFDFTA